MVSIQGGRRVNANEQQDLAWRKCREKVVFLLAKSYYLSYVCISFPPKNPFPVKNDIVQYPVK